MRHDNATNFQRFMAFFIDFMLLSIVSGLILSFIPVYQKNYTIVLNYFQQIMEGTFVEDLATLKNILFSALKMLGIKISFELPIFFLYLVVLPYFWKPQTLGRAAKRLRVISQNEEKAGIGKLALRELIGGYLLLNVLGGSFVFIFLTWYFSMTTGRSLADMIGGTRLIEERRASLDDLSEDEGSISKDYVEATFKDVTESEETSSDANSESEYDVF